MKKLITFLFIVSLYTNLNAQSNGIISISNNPAIGYINPPEESCELYSGISNETDPSDSLRLSWEVSSIQLPQGWLLEICDFNDCYFSCHLNSSSTDYSNVLPPMGIDSIQVTFHTYGIQGIGALKLRVTSENDPEVHYDLTYICSFGDDLEIQTVEGNVSRRADEACEFSDDNIDLSNWYVKATGDDNTFYTQSNDQGDYWLYAYSGDYNVSLVPPNLYWNICENDISTSLSPNISDTINFVVQQEYECPYLEVDISAPFIRRCVDNFYYVNYCNKGTALAEDAYLEVVFDDALIYNDCSITLDYQVDNLLSFDLGDIPVGECGSFVIDFYLDCDSTTLGQTHCIEAYIYPDSICGGSSLLWSGASIEVKGDCTDDEVEFKIRNIGGGNTNAGLDYFVIEDQVILREVNFTLNAGDSITVTEPTNGSTIRLEVDQEPFHPGFSMPSFAIEGCGQDNPDSISLGFINIFPQDDGNPFVSIDCQPNIDSFDPNDKQGFPLGWEEAHFIERDIDLEYMVRFQNTGTAFAINIVIIDTLDANVDPTSIRLGASSHPYEYSISNKGILIFNFEDIMLPDSAFSEVESQGFITYKISQKENLPLGTVINNSAAIYFDFNSPIITNTTFHTIGEKKLTVAVEEVYIPNFVEVFPNPFSGYTTFSFVENVSENIAFQLFDISGRLLRNDRITSQQYVFEAKNLSAGIYIYHIKKADQLIEVGKIIVE